MTEYAIQQGNTALPLRFLVVLSSDGKTGATGLAADLAVTICKNDGTVVTPSGAITELGQPGRYQIEADAADADTLGLLSVHVEGPGVDPQDLDFLVVDYDPTSAIGFIYGKVAGIGTSVTYTGPVSLSGAVSLTRGDAYEAQYGTALSWSSSGWVNLAGADRLEMIDPLGTAYPAQRALVHLEGGQTKQVLTVEMSADTTLGLLFGVGSYVLRAVFGSDNVTLANGPITVGD